MISCHVIFFNRCFLSIYVFFTSKRCYLQPEKPLILKSNLSIRYRKKVSHLKERKLETSIKMGAILWYAPIEIWWQVSLRNYRSIKRIAFLLPFVALFRLLHNKEEKFFGYSFPLWLPCQYSTEFLNRFKSAIILCSCDQYVLKTIRNWFQCGKKRTWFSTCQISIKSKKDVNRSVQ